MTAGARVFDLEQPRTEDMPIHPAHRQAGYSYHLHRRHEDEYRPEEAGPRTGAAGIIVCGEHTGTHIDALCHQSDALTLFGDVPAEPQDSFDKLSSEMRSVVGELMESWKSGEGSPRRIAKEMAERNLDEFARQYGEAASSRNIL